ncbi:MAG: peptidase [Crenarchaeota archaeon]|nr:MAG: peptidase [Thermoproteota archaeon]RDJ34036.1 MAG: peptidase [Thermoproteota archaeon]RDJ36850.1 MAG: peptidase [Thermoproteota archaeon]RDJ37616.1 MAG: peptidase [Thermoproteota archaeon]
MIYGLGVLIAVSMLFITVTPAFAQHHGGSLAPPIDFGGMQVALSSVLSPEDFSFGDSKSANLSIRFFDSTSDTNIKSVTYRVQIFQDDNLVANEYFYDEDGTLDLEIRPTTGCTQEDLWKCTKYLGEKHAIAGAYYARGSSIPIIQGPVFDKSGDYNVKVSIVGATNPRTMTTTDLHFETFLSLPSTQNFFIKTANAEEYPISVKSFSGDVLNFKFDDSSNKFSYEIPFDWNHLEHHEGAIKQTISLPKSFSIFKQGHDVDVFVEGEKIKQSSILFDSSSANENQIRLSISHEKLVQIQNKNSNKNSMLVEISSGEKSELNHLDFKFENGYTAKVSWNSKSKSGEKIPFSFSFFDSNGAPAKNILFAYSLLDSSGKEFWSNIGSNQKYLGILSSSGTFNESVLLAKDGKYQMKVILTGQGEQNFAKFFTSQTEFEISSKGGTTETSSPEVPSWIKNNAGWWSKGSIGDSDFVSGIQYLVKEKIIKVSASSTGESSPEIPSWIKSNAGWWSEGKISDNDFLKGVEFLIQKGIIKVN